MKDKGESEQALDAERKRAADSIAAANDAHVKVETVSRHNDQACCCIPQCLHDVQETVGAVSKLIRAAWTHGGVYNLQLN